MNIIEEKLKVMASISGQAKMKLMKENGEKTRERDMESLLP